MFQFDFRISAGAQDLWALQFFVIPMDGTPDTVKVESILIHHAIGPHPGEGAGHPFFLKDLQVIGLGGVGGGALIRDMDRNGIRHDGHVDEAEAVLSGGREFVGQDGFTTNFKSWTVRIDASHVPEPGSFAIIGSLGLGGAAFRGWKQKRKGIRLKR
jgi:hypothetical protein